MSTNTECACTDVLSPSPVMFCDAAVGRDTSGNFSLSFKGLAVRADCNRFIAFNKSSKDNVRLIDVTGLTLSGCDALVYRVPVKAENIRDGDMVLISDCPFEVLYITGREGDVLTGFNGSGEKITYVAPERLGDCARYIRIVSVLDVVASEDGVLTEDDIMLVAGTLCCRPGRGAGAGDYSGDFTSSVFIENILMKTDKSALKTSSKLALLLGLQQSRCLESYILTKAFENQRV